MRVERVSVLLLLLITPMLTLSSCTLARRCEIGPQSHFVPPNSNVKTLGPVSVRVKSKSRFLMADIATGKDDLDIYNQALAQVPEANVIVDYRRVTSVKYFLLPFFTWKETDFTGMAAKIITGRQRLDGSPRADNTPNRVSGAETAGTVKPMESGGGTARRAATTVTEPGETDAGATARGRETLSEERPPMQKPVMAPQTGERSIARPTQAPSPASPVILTPLTRALPQAREGSIAGSTQAPPPSSPVVMTPLTGALPQAGENSGGTKQAPALAGVPGTITKPVSGMMPDEEVTPPVNAPAGGKQQWKKVF